MTSKEKAQQIAKCLSEKKADRIKIIDITTMSDIADYFVICSGNSMPQVKALFNGLEEQMEKQDIFAKRKEGVSEGRWVAVDYSDVMVHIFHKDARDIYSIDSLWNNGSNVTDFTE